MGDYMIDEFESLINKKSVSLTSVEIQEEINRIEESLNLPKTVSHQACNFSDGYAYLEKDFSDNHVNSLIFFDDAQF